MQGFAEKYKNIKADVQVKKPKVSNPLLKQEIEFFLDGCSGDEIRSIANGNPDAETLDAFKPEPSERELALRYLRLAARYVMRNYKLETFG